MEPKDPEPGTSASPKPWVKGGLAWKVFAYTFPVISLVVLATQIAVGWLNYQEQLATHDARARLTAGLMAEALSKPMWNLDEAVYQAQIKAIAQDASFRAAILRDEKGKILFRLGDTQAGGHQIEVDQPIKDPGGKEVIGRFRLVMSTESLRDNAIKQTAMGLAAILALLIGFFLTLHLAVRGLVKRPLDRLLAAMALVERKQWQKVDWRGSDEIGRVTSAFNRMVDGLKSGDEAKRLLRELEMAQSALMQKNRELQQANSLIVESIRCARRIQTAMLPDQRALEGHVKDIHVCWEPLHLVGGDYFWLERFGDKSLLLVIDCTGHGVPGAFMTLVVASALDRILHEKRVLRPSAILAELDEMVRARLRQDQPDSDSDDGLEAGVCLWDSQAGVITFAGAGLPLLYAQGGEVRVMRGGRDLLGYRTLPPKGEFIDQEIQVQPGMSFYLLTDGAPDHMGGEPPRLLGRKRLARIIKPLLGQPMARQLAQIERQLEEYRGREPRRDDMTLVGFVPR